MTIHTEINPLGHRTAYLWEQVWERTSWLEIIGRYVIAKKNKKKQIESYIFPRYHQLDVTRKLQAAVNDLFKGELTDNDKLVYVNNVILGKLLESKVLIQQALNNSKEQQVELRQGRVGRFVLGDLIRVFQRQTYVVQAMEQAMSTKRLYNKCGDKALSIRNDTLL